MSIALPDPKALNIPGLSFRGFRGEDDFQAMVDIMDACNRVDQAEYNESVEDVAHVFTQLTNCDPKTDMLFAEVAGLPAGYARVFWKDEYKGPRIYIHLGFVVPAWRRRGLGRLMLQWSKDRLTSIAAEHETESDKLFHVWTTDANPGAMTLYESVGYHKERTMLEMRRPISLPIPQTDLLSGIEIRPVQPDHYLAIWDAWEEGYRDHWGYAPRPNEQFIAWKKSRRFQPHLWKIAWDGEKIAGLVLNHVDERRNAWVGIKRGYTQEIFVLRPWRRRGLARFLLTESVRMFSDMGMKETLLGVDSENPFCAHELYESLGYETFRRHYAYRKPLVV